MPREAYEQTASPPMVELETILHKARLAYQLG